MLLSKCKLIVVPGMVWYVECLGLMVSTRGELSKWVKFSKKCGDFLDVHKAIDFPRHSALLDIPFVEISISADVFHYAFCLLDFLCRNRPEAVNLVLFLIISEARADNTMHFPWECSINRSAHCLISPLVIALLTSPTIWTDKPRFVPICRQRRRGEATLHPSKARLHLFDRRRRVDNGRDKLKSWFRIHWQIPFRL